MMARNSTNPENYRKSFGPMDKETTALVRMQRGYWSTKQHLFKKLGKKEDSCIVASDSVLDAKLCFLQHLEDSFLRLLRVIEKLSNQNNKCALLIENLGIYFNRMSSGKDLEFLYAMGDPFCSVSGQMVCLETVLVRFYEEVETFIDRALSDTFDTVDKMEKCRTAYRGCLMWLKDASKNLDPDEESVVKKYKKVQTEVKTIKVKFDDLKLKTYQKIDLLGLSRSNLCFKHADAYLTFQRCIFRRNWTNARKTLTKLESLKGPINPDVFERSQGTPHSSTSRDKHGSSSGNAPKSGDQRRHTVSKQRSIKGHPKHAVGSQKCAGKELSSTKKPNKKERKSVKGHHVLPKTPSKHVTGSRLPKMMDEQFEMEDILIDFKEDRSPPILPAVANILCLEEKVLDFYPSSLLENGWEKIEQSPSLAPTSICLSEEKEMYDVMNILSQFDPLLTEQDHSKTAKNLIRC